MMCNRRHIMITTNILHGEYSGVVVVVAEDETTITQQVRFVVVAHQKKRLRQLPSVGDDAEIIYQDGFADAVQIHNLMEN